MFYACCFYRARDPPQRQIVGNLLLHLGVRKYEAFRDDRRDISCLQARFVATEGDVASIGVAAGRGRRPLRAENKILTPRPIDVVIAGSS